MNDTKFKVECCPENAPLVRKWIAERGGVVRWQSINLSNPGASWTAPYLDAAGNVKDKPGWQAGEPVHITSEADVGVCTEALYRTFPISLKRRSMKLVLSDRSQAKLDRVLDQCRADHGTAFYRFDVDDQPPPNVGVYFLIDCTPLNEWRPA